MRPPAAFSSFGQPVLAVADGVVVRASDRQRDHRSRESWASLAYLFVVEGFFREVAGPPFILGNHLVVDHGDGSYSTYAHLRRGSLRVSAGDEVHTGQQLAEVGNSGNTTEPHLHLQVMDDPRVTAAAGVPFRWSDVEIARPLPARLSPCTCSPSACGDAIPSWWATAAGRPARSACGTSTT